MEELSKVQRITMELTYIIILAAAAMGDMQMFSVSITRMMKAISILIIIMGVAFLLVSGSFERIKTTGRFFGIYACILVGIIVWSLFLWIINLESMDFILRGVSKFAYQFLVLLIMFSAAYMFGERAIFTTFYGLALANTIMIIYNLGIYGPVESLNSIITMIQGLGQEGFARAMEIHDITFAYGFFVIYMMFFAKPNKERNICLIVSIIYFLLGWKRIALAALPIVLVLGFILGKVKPEKRISFMKFMAWFFVVIAFVYVLITRVGLFETITEYFNIDTMGRTEIYNYIEKYYDISIDFMGYGFEYTTVILQQVAQNNPSANIGVVALHNNILTIYIELGFICFWAWLIYTWVFQLNWMIKNWGDKVALLFFLCEIYIFITYFTDNTVYYFFTSLVLRLIPLGYALGKPDEKDYKLWPWNKKGKDQRLLEKGWSS